MSSPILPIGSVAPEILAPSAQPKSGAGFGELFDAAVGRVEQLRTEAGQSVERFLGGEGEELHGTILATQRAELAFELLLQVRNKAVQAYQEIMRMQM